MAKAKIQTIDVTTLSKDIPINAKTTYSGIYFKGLTDFGSLNFEGSDTGNDLTITVNEHKIVLKDYFAKNGKFPVKTIKTDSTETPSINIVTYVNDNYIKGAKQNWMGGVAKTLTTTVFDDTIEEGAVNQTINAAGGNDLIYASSSNSTLTGGTGINTIEYFYDDWDYTSFGKDIIKLTKGETLNLNVSYNNDSTTEPIPLTFTKGTGKGINDLIITNEKNTDDSITIKNYYGKETGATVLINGKDLTQTTADFLAMDKLTVANTKMTGSALADVIDATGVEQQYKTVKKKGKKVQVETDLTINAGAGNDEITGSDFADKINGGKGNDTINGSFGADKITGGVGANNIIYTSLDELADDKIYLTKGEKLSIDISAITTNPNNVIYTLSGNNLDVTVTGRKYVLVDGVLQQQTTSETFTIINFGTKDVTNNTTKKTSDTSAVNLVYGVGENDFVDLRNVAQVISSKGTWHNDFIDKSDFNLYTDKKKTIVDYTKLTRKGVSVNGGAGADEIIGSRYSDTIKAGTGTDDFITGGTGNDKLYASTTKGSNTTFNFSAGDGKDTVYSGKGEDTLNFENVSIKNISMSQGKGKNNKDLIIKYNDNEGDSVTIKNYYTLNKKGKITGINKNNTIKHFTVMEGMYELNSTIIGNGELVGNDNDNTIIGSAESDIITAGKGNDIIFAGGGDDKYIFNTGDGEDTINYVSGNEIIKFNDVTVDDMDFVRNGEDLEIHYGDNDVVTIKDYGTSIETIKIEDSTEKQYGLIHGWNSASSNISSEGNHILVGTNSNYGETIRVLKGENYFFGNGGSDELGGYSTSTNTYVIKNTSSFSTTIYSETKRDTVKFVDVKLEDLTFAMDGDYATIKYNDSTIVRISNFIKNGDMNLLDYEGNTSTVSTELGIIFGDGENPIINGTETPDIIYGTSLNETITGGKGNDTIYGVNGDDTYVFNKGDGNDTLYAVKYGTRYNDIIKFADSTMEELDFIDNDSNHLTVKYNGGEDSVFVNLYFWPGSAGASVNQATKFMVKDDETVYSIADYGRHVVENDGETTEYVGKKMGDIFSSSTLNETFEGKDGRNIYNFTTGSIGTDTIKTTSGKDIINFSDVKVSDLTFTINENNLEITKDTEKVILQDYMLNLTAFSVTGADETSKTSAQILGDLGFTIGEGEITGTADNDKIIGSSSADIITAGKGNDVMSGGAGNDTYIFNDGDGEDILTYASGNDTIWFKNSVVTDMDFVRRGDEVDIYYGTSDKLTLKNYKTSDDTIKIKDSTEREYTLRLGTGWNATFGGSNSVFVGAETSKGRDIINANDTTGQQSVVFGNGGFDELRGYGHGGKVTYMIKKTHDENSIFSMYPDVDSTIKFVDTTFSDISIRKSSESDYYIYFNENNSRLKLSQIGRYYNDYNIIDSTGTSKTLSEGFGFIFGSEEIAGTVGADNIITTGTTAKIEGNGGNDIITNYNSGKTAIYTYKEGQKDAGSSTVSVYNGWGSGMNVYAQSAENYIYNICNYSDRNDNFFVYIDQKTYIQDNGGNNDSLTLTNTVSTTDGAKNNLHVLFNVSSTYTAEQGASAIGDIIITDTATKANYDAWKTNNIGGNYKGISIKNNAIENIKSSDDYTLTSADIATLGQSVATWLSNSGYTSVDGVFSNVLGKADDNASDIATLIAQFDNANWQSI